MPICGCCPALQHVPLGLGEKTASAFGPKGTCDGYKCMSFFAFPEIVFSIQSSVDGRLSLLSAEEKAAAA